MMTLKYKTVIDKQCDRIFIRNAVLGTDSITGILTYLVNNISIIKEVVFHKCFLTTNIDLIELIKHANKIYPNINIRYYSDCEITDEII